MDKKKIKRFKNKEYEECEIEYANDIDTDIKIRSYAFQPSKMKEKEELRRMAQDYIDR